MSSTEIETADERTILRIGDACLQAGDRLRAATAYWAVARQRVALADQPKAAALFKRVIEIIPNDPRVRLELAQCYEQLERRREASEQYTVLGQLLEVAAPLEASTHLIRAIELDPMQWRAGARLTALRYKHEALFRQIEGEAFGAPEAAPPSIDLTIEEAYWASDEAVTIEYGADTLPKESDGQAEEVSFAFKFA